MMKKYWIRAGAVCILCLVSWVVYISSKQLARNARIENEVTVLKQQADKIRRENETLAEKVHYFASNDFREQEAKEKLGMKKTGEEVIVIKSRAAGEEPQENSFVSTASTSDGELSLPRYKKWWHLFFPPQQ